MAKLFSSGVYPALGVHTPFDADDKLVTSPIFSPLVLASLRLLLAVWTLVVLVADLSYTSVHANYLLDGYVSLLSRALVQDLTYLKVLCIFHAFIIHWHLRLLLGIWCANDVLCAWEGVSSAVVAAGVAVPTCMAVVHDIYIP